MDKYLLLVWDRCNTNKRFYIRCDNLERAHNLAYNYAKDYKYTVEIYPMPELIEVW